VKIKLRVLFY